MYGWKAVYHDISLENHGMPVKDVNSKSCKMPNLNKLVTSFQSLDILPLKTIFSSLFKVIEILGAFFTGPPQKLKY